MSSASVLADSAVTQRIGWEHVMQRNARLTSVCWCFLCAAVEWVEVVGPLALCPPTKPAPAFLACACPVWASQPAFFTPGILTWPLELKVIRCILLKTFWGQCREALSPPLPFLPCQSTPYSPALYSPHPQFLCINTLSVVNSDAYCSICMLLFLLKTLVWYASINWPLAKPWHTQNLTSVSLSFTLVSKSGTFLIVFHHHHFSLLLPWGLVFCETPFPRSPWWYG